MDRKQFTTQTQETQKVKPKTRRELGAPSKRVNYAEKVLTRNIPVYGNPGLHFIVADWWNCPTCGGTVDNGQQCPRCSQPELVDDWFIINSVGGTTRVSRDGKVRYDS